MSDLVERLFKSDAANALTNEAARELEARRYENSRLRGELAKARHHLQDGVNKDTVCDHILAALRERA